jgi:L-2,4-diaminobutyrate decarboxylase
MLQLSGLCAAVLVRDGTSLERAFQRDASHLFYDREGPGVDLRSGAVERTKAALGLKLFLAPAAGGD